MAEKVDNKLFRKLRKEGLKGKELLEAARQDIEPLVITPVKEEPLVLVIKVEKKKGKSKK